MVLDIHHFSYGLLTPVLAYVISMIGCFLGLRCASRARARDHRAGWLLAAALAIGGTGIWVMHFIAMLGFSINKATIRYNIPLTLLSAMVAILVVGIGLFIVGLKERGLIALLVGGTITGSGVAAMHYTGMAAMHTDAAIHYDPRLVALSVVIGIVASTVALWFTLWVDGIWTTIGAAAIMGVAVCGMHYTGMASMSAHATAESMAPQGATVAGASVISLVTPLLVVVGLSIAELVLNVDMSPVDPDAELDEPPAPPEPPIPADPAPVTEVLIFRPMPLNPRVFRRTYPR